MLRPAGAHQPSDSPRQPETPDRDVQARQEQPRGHRSFCLSGPRTGYEVREPLGRGGGRQGVLKTQESED